MYDAEAPIGILGILNDEGGERTKKVLSKMKLRYKANFSTKAAQE